MISPNFSGIFVQRGPQGHADAWIVNDALFNVKSPTKGSWKNLPEVTVKTNQLVVRSFPVQGSETVTQYVNVANLGAKLVQLSTEALDREQFPLF